ncbi:hypothetical protein [Ovoidimarina sediminis]|uniref:hypothetical protein n=1 Tax=Ovoidimarina sediminis TaxID=3079856 RepID=UPI00290B892D|nr:hypothetical protein [Rhodophyticola sp. MJ-SS7]MDU8945987.1 hypothetical protein [Rhodophyticola sp. MJ-SS7]
MKIDLNSHFPHPVLSDGNDDFLSGSFDLQIAEVRESTDGNVEVDYVLSLISSDVQMLIDEGSAQAGAFIRCQDTFFSELRAADNTTGTWNFDRGALHGKVEVKPAIWLMKPVENWTAESLNPEFGAAVSIRGSEIIGLANDIVFSIGQDKLRKFESIFELVPSDDIPKGRLKLDLLADAIRILAPVDLFKSIEQLRGTRGGKPMLLSAVYMPVVMEVLESIRGQGATGFEDRPWYRVFSAKCEHLGIDIERAPLLESAQRLLGSPVEKLGGAFTEIMDNV